MKSGCTNSMTFLLKIFDTTTLYFGYYYLITIAGSPAAMPFFIFYCPFDNKLNGIILLTYLVF